MNGIETNDFSAPADVRRPNHTTVEVVRLGDGEIGRYTFEPGWRWSQDIKPIVGTDSCQTEHIGYLLSGTLHVVSDDGTTADVSGGNVYRIAPGHDAWVVGDQPAVAIEFQGASNYAKH